MRSTNIPLPSISQRSGLKNPVQDVAAMKGSPSIASSISPRLGMGQARSSHRPGPMKGRVVNLKTSLPAVT